MKWSVLWSVTTTRALTQPGTWTRSLSAQRKLQTKTTGSTVAGLYILVSTAEVVLVLCVYLFLTIIKFNAISAIFYLSQK